MQDVQSSVFGIIINDDQEYTVWPVHRQPPQGWSFTPAQGTRAAMQACVEQQFVPTAPSVPVDLDRRYRSAEWAAAEFDD